MARTTLRALHADSERRRWTLSERVVDENLGGYRRVPQQQTRRQRRDDRDQELIDVAWLYAWSQTGLHRSRSRGAHALPPWEP